MACERPLSLPSRMMKKESSNDTSEIRARMRRYCPSGEGVSLGLQGIVAFQPNRLREAVKKLRKRIRAAAEKVVTITKPNLGARNTRE